MKKTPRLWIALSLLLVFSLPLRAQDDAAAKDHAKRVMDLLKQETFADVAREFNAQIAAAMSPQQLGQAWSTIRGQAGEFKSIIDQQVMSQGGLTVVITGCQFEKANLNYILALDAENKIAGLRFVPRT